MSILKKLSTTIIKPGSVGTPALPAIAPRAGYYREEKVWHTGVPTPESQIVGTQPKPKPQIEVRAASYGEIRSYLWSGSSNDLCGIRAMIMETVNNTEFQYTTLRKIGTLKILTVAYVAEHDAYGISVATRQSEDIEWPTGLRNKAFDYCHGIFVDVVWRFSDYYTCSVVNNVEQITAKGA